MGKSPVGQKGYTGNPHGRPKKGETLTDALREIVDKKALAVKLYSLAMNDDDIAALKYIYDRVDGRPVETVNQTIKEIPQYVGFADSGDPEDTDPDKQ